MWNQYVARLALLGAGLASGAVLAEPNGASIYASTCIACHQAGGAGIPGLAPPLRDNIGKHAATPEGREYLARVLQHGLAGSITVNGVRYIGAMPAQAALKDDELAAVMRYVLKDIEKINDLGWLTPEYMAELRLAGGTPNGTLKLRPKTAAVAK